VLFAIAALTDFFPALRTNPDHFRTNFHPYPAMAATSSLQKAGMSSTTRPQTMFPSRKAGWSTQVAPALIRSSLIPRLPVARCPATIPAEIPTSPAWQINPTIFPWS
jgi:hypothetical protein